MKRSRLDRMRNDMGALPSEMVRVQLGSDDLTMQQRLELARRLQNQPFDVIYQIAIQKPTYEGFETVFMMAGQPAPRKSPEIEHYTRRLDRTAHFQGTGGANEVVKYIEYQFQGEIHQEPFIRKQNNVVVEHRIRPARMEVQKDQRENLIIFMDYYTHGEHMESTMRETLPLFWHIGEDAEEKSYDEYTIGHWKLQRRVKGRYAGRWLKRDLNDYTNRLDYADDAFLKPFRSRIEDLDNYEKF